jgi:hypothetical protein
MFERALFRMDNLSAPGSKMPRGSGGSLDPPWASVAAIELHIEHSERLRTVLNPLLAERTGLSFSIIEHPERQL